jgi:hypothetical protein
MLPPDASFVRSGVALVTSQLGVAQFGRTCLLSGAAATIVLSAGRHAGAIRRAASGRAPAGRVGLAPSRSSQLPPRRHLAGGVAYRRLFAGILLCCAKDLLFHAKGTTYWRRPAGLSDWPFMRNSDIRHADTMPSAVGGITRFACEYAKERGIDVEALLQRSGLTPGQIEQPGVRLSVRSQI